MMLRIFLLAVLFGTSAAKANDKKEIAMGFSPAENAGAMETKSKIFSDYFEKKMGVKVKTFVATDYTALIEALRSGNIDLAWLPPFSYVQAEKMADAKILLKVLRHGRSVLYSALITRSDRNFKTLDDLKGKTIAWVDPASATGHIIPKAAVKFKEKMDPDLFFGRQVFAGGHDAVVLAVYNGTVDAGATWVNDPAATDGSWHMYLKENAGKIRAVFVSDGIPSDTLVTTNNFAKAEPELIKKTTNLLMIMPKDPEGKKILTDLYGVDGFEPATDKEYDIVRKAALATGVGKK